MSLFAELKRRNVIRVGVAYLVGAWLLLQVIDIVLPIIAAPDWVARVVLLLLALGFIPALVFAWVFQVTPEGLRRDTGGEGASVETARNLDRVTIAMLVVVAGLVLFDRFLPRGHLGSESNLREDAPSQQAGSGDLTLTPNITDPVSATATGTPSVAVLPFTNMSPDPDNEYFSDGITEELLNLLVKVQGLRVPSRTSSFAFKGQNTDIREIARQLDVGHILEGSVRKAGNQVRITAQLIDVSTDTHLWSETYDRELKDIFAIQNEIATHIVESLQVVLGAGVIDRQPTDNMDAYTLYLQGLYQFQQRGEHLREAESLLRQAVEQDPGFAQAWAVLGLTLVMKPNYLFTPPEEALPQALEAADRAEAIDPNLPEIAMVRADAASKNRNTPLAIQLHERNVERFPHHSLARTWFAITLLEAGYTQAAQAQLELSFQQDPASGLILHWLAAAQLMNGHVEAARRNARQALKFGRWAAIFVLARIGQTENDPQAVLDDAAGLAEPFRSVIETAVRIWAGEVSIEQGLADFQESYPEARDDSYFPYMLAQVTRDNDHAIPAIIELSSTDVTTLTGLWVRGDAALRNDPRIRALIRDFRLPEVWRQRGFPPLCRPLGDEDFECD